MQKGQSLIEMIVVIGVVVILVTGIIAGTSAALSRAKDSETRSGAIRYAQEGIELARRERDNGWTAFAALGAVYSTYCVGDAKVFPLPSSVCSTTNVGNTYIRSVNLELKDPGDPIHMRMAVDVVVQWGDITKPGNAVELKTDLTEWR